MTTASGVPWLKNSIGSCSKPHFVQTFVRALLVKLDFCQSSKRTFRKTKSFELFFLFGAAMPGELKVSEIIARLRDDPSSVDEIAAVIQAVGIKKNASVQKALRDQAIRELAAISPGCSPTATAKLIATNLSRYESTLWRTDSKLAWPLETFSLVRKARFWALRHNGGRTLAYRKIFEIIDKF